MYLYILSFNTTGKNMDHFALEAPGCVVLYVGSVYLHEMRGMQPSGFLPNADIGVYAPISVFSDIDTDIGADFNDTLVYTDSGVYPISGIPYIG